MSISEQAIIDSSAQIAADVEIGPWSLIGPNVSIGPGCKIGPHVVIKENTRLGTGNKVHAFASIGGDPQVKQYDGADNFLEIGDHNIIHEYVTINRGDSSGENITKIGDRNLFMAYVHVAHDCVIANDCVFVNNAGMAGHVIVEDFVVLGAYCAVHQFCTLGAHSFMSRGAMVTQDVLPYTMIAGNPATATGINKVGLARRGFYKTDIADILAAYKLIFRSGLLVKDVLQQLKQLYASSPYIAPMLQALERSERGIVR